MKRKRPKVVETRLAGKDHAVSTLVGGGEDYAKQPCAECPWRLDQVGKFPPEAFILSANVAYDMDRSKFACHVAGAAHALTCAGFLLRNGANNLGVRLDLAAGKINLALVSDVGLMLHASYREMAVANGVPPDHPALARCRADTE